ncbi:MAG: FhaA domain-containing protein [Anaerolineales bacterium]
MKKPLSKIEERMESLVEGTFARLFAGRLHPRDVALQLARALEDSCASGQPALRYAVRVNPNDAQTLLGEQPRLAEILAEDLVAAAREGNITLPRLPEIFILPESQLKPRAVTVTAEAASIHDTAGAVPVTAPLDPATVAQTPNAFLILEGERTVPLTQPVLSLGRRLDNHIIIDDPRVSRAHAQLRLRFGRYVLYDLGSTGGTYVNGQRVQEFVLRPGDVISLAGVPVIYGEDEEQRPTQPVEPPTPTRARPDLGTHPFDPGPTQPR